MSQRARYLRVFSLTIVVASAAVVSALVRGQEMGGSFPSMPKTMFGRKQDDRDVSGPSLSATNENVAAIRIVGNSTIPETQILNQLQTRVGRPFDPALVQRDIRKLASRGWFVDVQPGYEESPNGRIVIFKVVERPVVRYVYYAGNYGIRTSKLEKETDLKVGGPVDPYAVQEARRRIVELYHRNGFNNVQVSILEGDKPTDHGIVFVIDEGLAQKIWKVEFVGNEFVSSRRLKTKIDSKPPLLWLFKGYVDDDEIEADKNKLIAYYRSFGYFDAKVGREKIFDDKNKWMTLRFVIHEGPRYQVESVAFIGNRIFSSDSLTTGIELKPDANTGTELEKTYHKYISPLPPGPRPFEQDRMNADVAWLKELYGSQGYVFADIKAEPIFLEEPGKLKLLYHIDEGKRWRVGNIYVHINGDNSHTKIQTALNRLSFRSGQIADIREIHASERRLQASGLFMADAAKGMMPKITYHIPELQKTEMAKGDSSGFRGQSPDDATQAGMSLVPAEGLPIVNPDPQAGPPLIGPPQTFAGSAYAPAAQQHMQTYKVEPPADFVPNPSEQIELHLYLDAAAPAAKVEPAAAETEVEAPHAAPAGPQFYEARRPPYDDATTTTDAAPATADQPSVYQHLVIRTQSPYQPATGAGYPSAPPASSPYGGLNVGATGPDAAPAGTSYPTYPANPVAITEPQLPPGGPAAAPAVVAPQPSAIYGPPPISGQPAETLPAPGTVQPAPGYSQPASGYASPQPAPGGQLFGPTYPMGGPPPPPRAPNINAPITPITPLPNGNFPADSFTPMTDPAVDMDVVVSEAQTGRLMLGVAVNSDAGLVGQILLDERNFDILRPPTSWDDFWSGRAWRGAGEGFRIEAAPGTQVQRYLVSFQEPYLFDSPYSLGLSGSYFQRQYRDWDEQRVGGRVSLGYQWVENDLSTSIAYRGEDVEISNISVPIPELTEVLGHNAVHGFSWTVANDTRDNAFLATEGHFLQMQLEEVVGSFQYPRAIFDARQYILLNQRPDYSGRHVLTLSTRVGFSGNDTPVYDRFFAGGFSSLRGFDFRGASPVIDNAQVGGDFEFINTVEYLFPLTADDMIHGVAFCDFGTVNENVAMKNFRVAPGIGLRITVPAMGPAPIALDFGFPVAKADTDQTQVFSFSVGLQR